jgi:pyruvate/2-oxoglutarate dehydrogenase complex dihydrolipoamide acyltransferase (E2) component
MKDVKENNNLNYFYKMKTPAELNSGWRKVASSIYRRPVDSKIFGSVEIDITDLELFIAEKRKNGIKATLTHIFILAAARALKQEIPELNTFIKRGNVVKRDHIDVMVSVLLRDSKMGSVLIKDADTLTLNDLVRVMKDEINKSRKGDENKTMQMKDKLARIPWPVRGWVYRVIKTVTMDWGFSFPSLGLSANSFGSFIVSNIGSLGLDMGYPALFPSSNVSFVLILGGVNRKPTVVNEQIVPRTILSLGAALDHRVVDASHGGLLFRYLKNVVNNPHQLDVKNITEKVRI